MFMEHSVILWDQLKIIMKICGSEGEGKSSFEHHIKRNFMVNAYQVSEIWYNTGGCSGGLKCRQCIQHFGWEMS